MDPVSIIVWLIIGAIAGWAAGELMRGEGFGVVGNMVVGIIGALIGGFLFSALGIMPDAGLIGSFITALIGAIILLFIVGLLRRSTV